MHLYLVPNWFLGYDIILQLVFAIITLLVSINAFRIYRLSGQRQSRLFAQAFLFITLAYLMEAFLNFMILSRLNANINLALKVISVETIKILGLYAHMILFSIGLAILAYMTFHIESARAYSLLLILVLLSLFLASNPLLLYHILLSILLIYIFIHYLLNYLRKKNTQSLLILIAFASLLFSNIQFIFSVINNEIYYVMGHVFELAAYVLILINLMMVQKHEQKKRPASNHS